MKGFEIGEEFKIHKDLRFCSTRYEKIQDPGRKEAFFTEFAGHSSLQVIPADTALKQLEFLVYCTGGYLTGVLKRSRCCLFSNKRVSKSLHVS